MKTLESLADYLVSKTRDFINTIRNEEELRIKFEKILEPVLSELDINSDSRYELTIYNAGQADALHGQVVIEYETPKAFRRQSMIKHSHQQLLNYILGLTLETKQTLFLFGTKFIGIGFDGEQIFFVKYKGDKKAKSRLDRTDFTMQGPYAFSSETARTFLYHLRALARLPLNAENLASKFGPQSKLASNVVSAFTDALENWGNERVKAFYNEWKRLFGIVYGEHFAKHQLEEVRALSRLYKVGENRDMQELLFSIHTYFTFLLKLIAAELLALRDTALTSSLAHDLANSNERDLKTKLTDIEEGGIYARRGITNFLEGDFFRWYLDAWSPRVKDALQECARALSEFEPATSTIDPDSTKDLLKKLYQYLVPKEVRHKLGEYYTPDWLAELLINETGYDGKIDDRLLDPACGSGTFLVLAIQKARENAKNIKLNRIETIKRIIRNIWGFDLNPLAVIASRTNYLFALGDLINELPNLEIPVYLADSILWPEQVIATGELNFYGGDYLRVITSVKEFRVPRIWVKDKGILMKEAAPLIEKCVKNGYDEKQALKHFKSKGIVFPPHEQVVMSFYKDILGLEKENKNGIWARFLKNAFAPYLAGKFDYVIGNPPWIRWGYLSQDYRAATLQMWKDYGLFSLRGHAARLGGGEKDFSMLFTYAASDYYLKDKAKLGFLITQEVFKSKGAGEGFRRFRLSEENQKDALKVLKALDLVTVQPFEGAANKTAAIILRRGEVTKYPVTYLIYNRKKKVGKIPTDLSLDVVSKLLEKKTLSAKPMIARTGSWQTIGKIGQNYESLKGKNSYKARLGARVEPYGVFWLAIEQVMSNGDLIVRNLTEYGDRVIQKVEEIIESDLVYPTIRGSDIQRWAYEVIIHTLISQDPKLRKGYSEDLMKSKYPKTYSYLLRFKNELLDRAAYKKYHEPVGNPFYSQYNIAEYTIAPYKVVWKRMTNDIFATVITQCKTSYGYKTIIPTDTTSLFATNNEDEAHYLCAVINSKIARDFIKSFSSAGRGFGTPSVMQHVGIPKYDLKNKIHSELVEISKSCHNLKKKGEENLKKYEDNLEIIVARLFK